MKRGVYAMTPIDLYAYGAYMDRMRRIEVRVSRTRTGTPVRTAHWMVSGGGECELDGTTLLVPWTREQTQLIPQDTACWVDVRPTLTDGTDIAVPPIQMVMHWSLYNQVERNVATVMWDDPTKTLTIL